MTREIDAEIAEKIMGLKICLGSPTLPELRIKGGWQSPDDWLLLNDDGSVKLGTSIPGGSIRLTVPHYSSDIAAAMEVAEEMRGDLQWSINSDGHDWSAELWRGQTTEVAQGRDKSLAKAICLAALSATRGE